MPCVADLDGVCDLGGGNDDSIAVDDCVRPDELAVCTCDCEAFDLAVGGVADEFLLLVSDLDEPVVFGELLCDESAVDEVECDADFIAFDGCLLGDGAGVGEVLEAVVLVQCDGCEACADGFLVDGVDVPGFADVDEDCLAGLGKCQCAFLTASDVAQPTLLGSLFLAWKLASWQ